MSAYTYDKPGATLPPIPFFPPGGPAVPPPACPLGGEYYYPRENWWMPYPQQSFSLIPPWPRMPVRAAGPQGYELSPVAAAAEFVNPRQIGIGGITAVAMGARGCPTPWSERTLYSRPKAADVQEYIVKEAAKERGLANAEAKLMPPRWWPWG